jgi:hypothetical protein
MSAQARRLSNGDKMSIADKSHTPPASFAETIEERFQRLASLWRTETSHISSSTDQVAHPAFQEIVEMGRAVVPILLRELEQRSGHWHRALKRITGDDPVPPSDRGNLPKIREAWLRWGKEHGCQW